VDQQLPAMTFNALFAGLRPKVHAWKLCHNCAIEPVLAAKTDDLGDVRLLILRNLLKTKMWRKNPAYRFIPHYSIICERFWAKFATALS
jgi:hypothetical protein